MADGAQVTNPVTIIGTANGNFFPAPPNSGYQSGWFLVLAPAENPNAATTINSGTNEVTNGVLGTLDPTLMINGLYTLTLYVVEQGGDYLPFNANISVTGNEKVGNFTLSFTDLNVPVSGIPMQVIRTYDSRNKTQGDFGIGWTLDVSNIQVETTGDFGGSGWEEAQGGDIITTYTLVPTQSHIVVITFPNGKVYRFQPISNSPPVADPITTDFFTFQPLYGTAPTCKLQTTDPGFLKEGGEEMTIFYNSDTGETDVSSWDPQEFILTDETGKKYKLKVGVGLESMTDLNGNVLSVGSGGIQWAGAKAGQENITFNRDSQGRIYRITDPSGNVYNYTNDGAGNLSTYQDPAAAAKNEKTSYTYNNTHGLTNIKDPLGDTPIRNDYDANGRLIDTIDAYGNKITYNYNLAANSQSVTNRLSQPTSYLYDNNGNILVETQYLNGAPVVTSYTYSQDGYNNKLTETDPLHHTTTYEYKDTNTPPNPSLMTKVTDPLGHSTSYTYDLQGHVVTTTDANGNVTTNAYTTDGKGNLASTLDALGTMTTYTYDANGNMTGETQAVGMAEQTITTYTYDGAGNMTNQTTASGSGAALSTDYTYDGNGNRKSQTVHNSNNQNQTTLYQYDGSNRLVETDYPDGTKSLTTYDALGHVVGTQDQKGRNTSYFFDSMGRQNKVQYPDLTTQLYGYDANGNRTSSTDRGGRTTTTGYDDLGRAAGVTLQDGTYTFTNYDAGGRVISTVDENHHATSYQYDDAGRRTQMTDALSYSTGYGYDNNGNQTSVQDANLNTTTFTYDALNRQTKVTYPDTTYTQTGYDSLGRKTSYADQAKKTTQYQYDAAGHLTQVLDALSQPTLFGYDAVGNETSQMDANHHTTTYAYNNMNQRVSRTLPGGQQETYSYDATGNVSNKVDFNSHTLTYGYDLNDRLNSEIGSSYAATLVYDTAGRRASETVNNHTISYNYDVRDRLSTKTDSTYTLNYGYDHHENLTSINSSNGGQLVNSFDSANRLVNVMDTENQNTVLGYDQVGNLTSRADSNAVTNNYTYDTLNRLTTLTVGSLNSYTYTLGPTGNRTKVVEAEGRTGIFVQDDLYRLQQDNYTQDPNVPDAGVTYSYDPVGNRLQKNANSFNFDTNDRISTTGYNFDLNGNMLSDPATGNSYQYDINNRLISVTKQNGDNITYTYDFDGNRISKTLISGGNTTTTVYVVDGNNLTGYSQVFEEMQGGQVTVRYAYGTQMLSQNRFGTTNTKSYFEQDGQGSVRIVTDGTGTPTDTLGYTAFGESAYRTGPNQISIRYDGEYADGDTGLVYLRARWMNPGIGRFMGMDTDEGEADDPLSLHKYVFASNNPANEIDPSGNDSSDAIIGPTGARISQLLQGTLTVDGRLSPSLLMFSGKGKTFLKSWEGLKQLRGGRVCMYYDKVGDGITIGWGHWVHDGYWKPSSNDEQMWMGGITPEAADGLFDLDVSKIENMIIRHVQVPLKQQEFDALVSLGFNLKPSTFLNSNVIYDVNNGRYDLAVNQFIGIGKMDVGLLARRTDESFIFGYGVYINHK